MGVLNKRNAVLGWAVWNASKVVAKRKAKSAVTTNGSRRPTKAVAAGLAALGGALWFWRRRQGDSDEG
jgi:LPXTG-motif cell wall-anchored protein